MVLFAYEIDLLELSAVTLISGPVRITASVIQRYGHLSGSQFQLPWYQLLVRLLQSKEIKDKEFQGG